MAARIEVPGAGREPRQAAVALDASSYFVWADDARFSGGGHSAQIELRGVDGSPMAAPGHPCPRPASAPPT